MNRLIIGLGLALFAIPDLCWSRPMTTHESRCFELGEAVYQAAEPDDWTDPEPNYTAEWLSEVVYIDCLGYSSDEPEDDIYGWENFVCR